MQALDLNILTPLKSVKTTAEGEQQLLAQSVSSDEALKNLKNSEFLKALQFQQKMIADSPLKRGSSLQQTPDEVLQKTQEAFELEDLMTEGAGEEFLIQVKDIHHGDELKIDNKGSVSEAQSQEAMLLRKLTNGELDKTGKIELSQKDFTKIDQDGISSEKIKKILSQPEAKISQESVVKSLKADANHPGQLKEFKLQSVSTKLPQVQGQQGEDFVQVKNVLGKPHLMTKNEKGDVVIGKIKTNAIKMKNYGQQQNMIKGQFIQQQARQPQVQAFNTESLNVVQSVQRNGKMPQVFSFSKEKEAHVDNTSQEGKPQLSLLQSTKLNTNNISQNETQATQVVDLKSTPPTEVLNKVENYLQQAKLAHADEVQLVVKHDNLGDFQINVQKNKAGQTIDMELMTQTKEAKDFFVKHEAELTQQLSKSGIKLADFKVQMTADSKMSQFGERSSNQGSEFSQGRQEQGYQQQQRHSENSDSQRRRELWNQYKEQFYQATA